MVQGAATRDHADTLLDGRAEVHAGGGGGRLCAGAVSGCGGERERTDGDADAHEHRNTWAEPDSDGYQDPKADGNPDEHRNARTQPYTDEDAEGGHLLAAGLEDLVSTLSAGPGVRAARPFDINGPVAFASQVTSSRDSSQT